MDSFQIKRAFGFLFYNIIRPHRKGHGIHSPFVFDFVNNVLKKDSKQDISPIINFRKKLLQSNKNVNITDFGAGSAKNKSNTRTIGELVKNVSSSIKKGKLLYNLVAHYKPERIIELGTCLGFSTIYMAKASPESNIFTIEGSESLTNIAKGNFDTMQVRNIKSWNGRFEEILPILLNKNQGCDLLFIDGNHKKESTLEYFNSYLPYAKHGSIIVIDDIRWSEGMREAWDEICKNPFANVTIDLFDMGIVFFQDKIIKQHFRIYY